MQKKTAERAGFMNPTQLFQGFEVCDLKWYIFKNINQVKCIRLTLGKNYRSAYPNRQNWEGITTDEQKKSAHK